MCKRVGRFLVLVLILGGSFALAGAPHSLADAQRTAVPGKGPAAAPRASAGMCLAPSDLASAGVPNAIDGFDVRGVGQDVSRSFACQKAQESANLQCTNRFCIGCAELLPCDCTCVPLVGDFLCQCGASGRACIDPALTRQGDTRAPGSVGFTPAR